MELHKPLIPVSPRLEGIGEYYFSAKLQEIDRLNREGKQVINLGIGSPDMPPHEDVIRVLQEEVAKPGRHAYQSYRGAEPLRSAIRDWYSRSYGVQLDPVAEVLPLMGSKEGILHLCMAYLGEGDEVLVPDPGYPTYTSAVKLAGGRCRPYVLRESAGYYPDIREIEASGLDRVKLMFVSYPHMPTGEPGSYELFQQLVDFARRYRILLVHDNPYSFILNKQPLSLLQVPGAMDVAVELNSLSKSHNMAGWRVGMLCGAAERIQDVLRFKSNMDSGMFLPVQLAAARALALGTDWTESVNSVYLKRRERLFSLLDKLGCRFQKKQAGLFVWAAVPAGYDDGYALSDELLHRKGIFVTPGGIFGGEGLRYIRASLCAGEPLLEEAIRRLDNF